MEREGVFDIKQYYGWREEILKSREERKRQALNERSQHNRGEGRSPEISGPENQNCGLSDDLNNSQRC